MIAALSIVGEHAQYIAFGSTESQPRSGIGWTDAVTPAEARFSLPEGACSAPRVGILDLCCAAIAATLIPAGLIWDFSWESSIGVDGFWSPPHVALYVGGWLAGLVGLKLVLCFSFGGQNDAKAGIEVLGFRGPTGAWFLLWGAVVLQANMPFDLWWQRTYGLGAGIWPPPQIIKTAGFAAIVVGASLLSKVSGWRALTAWHGGLLVTLAAIVLMMRTYPNLQHTSGFGKISAAIFPALLLAVGAGSRDTWGGVKIALMYLLLWSVMVWLLPLFPAQPLTPPINNATDRMMPPPFPLLLVVPAMVMDFVRRRALPRRAPESRENALRQIIAAALCGIGFVAAFVTVQWFFAIFLLSASSDSWFFAGGGAALAVLP